MAGLISVYMCLHTYNYFHLLKLQVQARSYEIWEGSDGLEAEHQRRSLAREKKKERKYAKEIKGGNKAILVSIQDDINIALKFNSEVELNKLVHYVGFDHLSGLQNYITPTLISYNVVIAVAW